MFDDKDRSQQKVYDGQQRGKSSDYDRYFAGMDKTMQQKLAFTAAHFLLRPGAVIADMGCGSGRGSFQFAQINPHIQVIGIDINPQSVASAREKYKLPNLRFEVGDVEKPDPALGPFDGILNSSVLHHVYTFNNYDRSHVVNALKNQLDTLKVGGTVVIRDFVAWPDDRYVMLDVLATGNPSSVRTMSDADLLIKFSQSARPLNPEKGPGFFLEELDSTEKGWRRFRVSAKWANEFLLRKDYRDDWDVEVLEEYSWWTKEEYVRELEALGGRVAYTAPFWNSWIIENRFRDKVRISAEDGSLIDFPPTNFIAVYEKVAPGESLHVGERSISIANKSFLQIGSYENIVTGEVYDMAARPGEVRDFLPYGADEDGRLFVFVKHGYPRPIANTVARGTPVLDDKHWSGHMTEPLAATISQDPQGMIAERLAIPRRDLGAMESGLRYYPSPALVNEAVASVFMRVTGNYSHYAHTSDAAISGFSTSGDVRAVAAQDLLRAAQVGMLPEARLELNIYRLMYVKGVTPDTWLGSTLPTFGQKHNFNAAPLTTFLEATAQQAFKKTDKSVGYLRLIKSGFADRSAVSENARQDFEFVIPAKAGTNVVSVLPVARRIDGELYLGLEKRNLPAPQQLENNSEILVVPAYRLPNHVVSSERASVWIAQRLGVKHSQVKKMGEGYFSSIGITPERVYPYIAEVDPEAMKGTSLHFVKMRDVFANVDTLRDAHLMISTMRGVHGLNLWREYAQSI